MTTRYNGGVRGLEELRLRCVIDACTGCWEWGRARAPGAPRKAGPPALQIPPGVIGNEKRVCMNAARAAWIMAGRDDGREIGRRVIYRACDNPRCINPEHLRCGTRAQMMAHLYADGKRRGRPERAAVNRRNARKWATPPETARRIEALVGEGVPRNEVMRLTGVSLTTISRIVRHQHTHSAIGAPLSLASVFAWRGKVSLGSRA